MITTIRADGRTLITPAEGKSITNGEVYSKSVIVGTHDSVDRWHEIADADIPPPPDPDYDPLEELEGLL
jgi:hypothetical protein